MNEQILQEISDFCRARGLAESTFGRRAVNDGKLANRLRNGGRITTDTLDRIRAFMARNADVRARPPSHAVRSFNGAQRLPDVTPASAAIAPASDDPTRNFRFFDNRQKYLLFVNTCWRSGRSPTASGSNSRTSIRAHRRCACSTPVSATAPCCRA